MQSFAFVDVHHHQELGVAGPSKSPIFDFDDVWADHVLALRTTAKASFGGDDAAPGASSWLLPMDGVSPTAGVKLHEEWNSHHPHHHQWTSSAPVAHAVVPQQHFGDADVWMNNAGSAYSAIFPNTFEGYTMPIDQTSSTTSVSTLESPRSSRGSKRPPSTDEDEYDYDDDCGSSSGSPLEFASSKAKRPRIDVNGSTTISSGVHIAPAAPANNAVFILPTTNTNVNRDDEGGFWETVQGPWELSDIPPPPPNHMPMHHHAAVTTANAAFAFLPVRSMPPLQVPVPRLPQQIWSAAAALGSS